MMVDGKKVSGALLDFAILIFHNGKLMADSGSCFDDRSVEVDPYLKRDMGSSINDVTSLRGGLKEFVRTLLKP